MVSVHPLSMVVTNWRSLQKVYPDTNVINALKEYGVQSKDPAALSVLLNQGKDLNDAYASRFAMMQFLVIVPSWGTSCAALDEYEIGTIPDEDNKMHQVLVLSGTADRWRVQILTECKGNKYEAIRLKVFNCCFDHIMRTGLKTMFADVQRIRIKDGFLLQ